MSFRKKDFFIIVLFMIMIAGCPDFVLAKENPMSGKSVLGGPCEYKLYPGVARVVSIEEIRPSSNAMVKKYEIRFSFQPNQPVAESFATTEGKEFSLLDDNSVPDQTFVDRHDISMNKVFPCVMKVIVRGTCTPTIFEFPTFENTGR